MRFYVLLTYALAQIAFDHGAADSVLVATNADHHEPENALNNLLSFWCSEKQLETATYKAWFNVPLEIKGITVSWVYAPNEIRVLGTLDRKNDFELVPWRKLKSNMAEFEEDVLFEQTTSVSEIKLLMRGSSHGYFGIVNIKPILVGNETFMVLNGITDPSADEHCLAIMDGEFKAGGLISIETCAYAIGASDGRHLWHFVSDHKLKLSATDNLCLTYTIGNKTFVLEECDSFDVLSVEYSGSAQLKLNDQCIVAEGTPGYIKKVLDSTTVKWQASSVMSVDNALELAFDGSMSSYWASMAFPDAGNHNVFIDLIFNDTVWINKIEIDWEYPALSYSIMKSTDGINFSSVEVIQFNGLSSTIDDVGSLETKYLRILMERPHPELGIRDKRYLYGIRKLSILENGLTPRLIPCPEASISNNGADKWFRVYQHHYNLELSRSAVDGKRSIDDNMSNIGSDASELMKLGIDSCGKQVDGLKVAMDGFKAKAREIGTSIPESLEIRTDNRGLTPEDYIFECGDEMIGFYYLYVRCSPDKVLRMYCKSGIAYLLSEYDEVSSPENSVSAACAVYGLIPSEIRSFDDLHVLTDLYKIVAPKDTALILGLDYECLNTGNCSNDFYDLPAINHITRLVYTYIYSGLSTSNLVGFNNVGYFTSKVNELSFKAYVPCSLPKRSSVGHIAVLDCGTTGLSKIFASTPRNTVLRVQCPKFCGDSPIYGDQVYSPRSNICRAAIHSDTIPIDSDVFGVSITSSRAAFTSAQRNNITSMYDNGQNDYSLRFTSINGDCPILNAFSLSTSKNTQTAAIEQPDAMTNEEFTEHIKEAHNRYASTASLVQYSLKQYSPSSLEEITDTVYKNALEYQNKRFKIDKHALKTTRFTVFDISNTFRGSLKPIETDLDRCLDSMGVKDQFTQISKNIFQKLSKQFTAIETTQTLNEMLNKQRKQSAQSEFLLLDSYASSKFRIDSETNSVSFVDKARVRPDLIYDGMPVASMYPERLLFTETNVFDFTFSATLSFSGASDSIGIFYRFSNPFMQGYVLQLAAQDSPVVQKNVQASVAPGQRAILARLQWASDGNLHNIDSKWHSTQVWSYDEVLVDISVSHGNHTVHINGTEAVKAYHEYYMYGTLGIGISSSASLDAIGLAKISVERGCCLHTDTTHSIPEPTQCTLIKINHATLNTMALSNPANVVISVENANTVRLKRISGNASRRSPSTTTEILIKPTPICRYGIISFYYKAYGPISDDSHLGIILSDKSNKSKFHIVIRRSGLYVGEQGKTKIVSNAVRLPDDTADWSKFELYLHQSMSESSKLEVNGIEIPPKYIPKHVLPYISLTFDQIADLYMSEFTSYPVMATTV